MAESNNDDVKILTERSKIAVQIWSKTAQNDWRDVGRLNFNATQL